MRSLFLVSVLFLTINSSAQVLCGMANEGGTVTLTAPPNNSFTSIQFASYGTPNGGCNSFTIGACHANNSLAIVSAALLGQNSASISATNGVFGDPCNGTVKRLYIQATYSSTLPLTLVSFTAQKTTQGKIVLTWRSDEEVNTSHFQIERSEDGNIFETVGTVSANGSGANSYSFTDDVAGNSDNYFYRLRMTDIDGRFRFSSIARVSNTETITQISVFPNPANDVITIVSSKPQQAAIVNSLGQTLKQIRLIKGSQAVNISFCAPGVYFVKSSEGVTKFIRN